MDLQAPRPRRVRAAGVSPQGKHPKLADPARPRPHPPILAWKLRSPVWHPNYVCQCPRCPRPALRCLLASHAGKAWPCRGRGASRARRPEGGPLRIPFFPASSLPLFLSFLPPPLGQLFPSFPLHPVPVQALSQGRKKRIALSSPSLVPSPASGSPRCRAPAGARPAEWVSQPQRLELGQREQGHPRGRAGTPLFRLPAGQVRVPARGARVGGGACGRGRWGARLRWFKRCRQRGVSCPRRLLRAVPVSLIETRLREGVDRGRLRARRGWRRGRGPGEAPEGSARHRRAALLGDCYFERQRPPRGARVAGSSVTSSAISSIPVMF